MENAATDRATPTTVNSSVRPREYLTAAEIERLMAAARSPAATAIGDATSPWFAVLLNVVDAEAQLPADSAAGAAR